MFYRALILWALLAGTAFAGSTTPAGSNGQLQYNKNGQFGASSSATIGTTGLVSPNFTATGAVPDVLPVGTTGQRPASPVEGSFWDNTTSHSLEAYLNGAWWQVISSVSGLINLTSQVTGVLPVANGGTAAGTVISAAVNLGIPYLNIVNYGAISNSPNNNSTGITTSTSSKNVTISGLTTANVGNAIIFVTPLTTHTFQSTITGVSGTTITLNDFPDVSEGGRVVHWGVDSTSAIDATYAAAKTRNGCIYIPAGNYIYLGAGIASSTTWFTPCVRGEAQNNNVIYLGASGYFIDMNNPLSTADFESFSTYGGSGMFRDRSTTVNTNYAIYFHELLPYYYTSCAISFNSTDLADLEVSGTSFMGLNNSTSLDVCDAGTDNMTLFANNQYMQQRVALKLGGGTGVKTIGNDFIQYNGENPASSYTRPNIWIVPIATFSFGSYGFTAIANYFGNENLDTQDVRILIADQIAPSTGQYFGDTLWLTTVSTGTVSGMNVTPTNQIVGGVVGGTGSGVNPIVYSYTPNVYANNIGATLQGGYPGYVLQFDAVVTATNFQTQNVCGPFSVNRTQNIKSGPLLSNLPGYCQSYDPSGENSFSDPTAMTPFMSGSSAAGYVNLFVPKINSFNASTTGGGSKTQITDAGGGNDAITYTAGSAGAANTVFGNLAITPALGANGFCDADMRLGSTGTPMSSIAMQFADGFTSPAFYSKVAVLGTNWKREKLYFVQKVAMAHQPPSIQFSTVTGTVVGTTVDIGRVRCHSANEDTGGGIFDLPVVAPSYLTSSDGRVVNAGTASDTIPVSAATTYESANTGSGAFTATLAAPSGDGERRRVCFKNLTGTITWSPTSPATAVVGAPATVAAGNCVELVYNAVSGTPTNAPATSWIPY